MFVTHLALSYLPLVVTVFLFVQVTTFILSLAHGLTYTLFPVLGFTVPVLAWFVCFYYLEYTNYSISLYTYYQWFFNLFLVSEVCFFAGVFWSMYWNVYVFSSVDVFFLVSSPISPFGLALVNTAFLLLSSCFCNVFHLHHTLWFSQLELGTLSFYKLSFYLCLALYLGLVFLVLQFVEISYSPFCITQLGYACSFYLATGFHGFHVLLGAFLLSTLLANLYVNHIGLFSVRLYPWYDLGNFLSCVLVYWHFVDVIWIGLYYCLYFLPWLFTGVYLH